MAVVDVVVVSYNSEEHLRDCVEPLSADAEARVVVVDNASSDGSLAAIGDLPVVRIARPTNDGFATGCNAGWHAGEAPFVLFLNPDARIEPASLRRLVAVLEDDPAIAAAAPRLAHPDGSPVASLRRFPRIRSTYARALFLQRLFPRAAWSDDVVRDPAAYRDAHDADWVSGACILVRRSVLEEVGGWDEGFFLYGEDIDLCRRISRAGGRVRFEPAAEATHVGGASRPRAALLPVLAASRLRYTAKHGTRVELLLVRAGLALGAFTHLVVSRGGVAPRVGHARALARILAWPGPTG